MIAPRLVMILASAGSGKTHRLTTRFIALLAAGAAPERIVALTFTRKAAGEFFDGILDKLARAAAGEAAAAELAAAIGRPGLRPGDFLRLLRTMTDALHRLQLGTLDSFFARIAQAFPAELGLAGDFAVLEGHAATRARERALRQLFARGEGALDEAQHEFLEAFKQATFGTEEKQLGRRLDAFIDEHYESFLAAQAGEVWGRARRIWPDGQPWLHHADPATAVAAARRWLATAEMTDGQRARWEDFLAAVEAWSPGAPLPPLKYVLEKAVAAWSGLAAGSVELVIEKKKQRLDATGCQVLADLVRVVAGGVLRRQLEATQGLHAVLRSYDEVYDALVRRAGLLTFADVERLLRPDGTAVRFSFGPGGPGRLMLEYRLDATIDHWLLDEFQDTSRGQWSVLQNLIDEVVQDPDGRRTFFCVGDVKQSIYGWREGDPTLMDDIRAHYNGDRGAGAPIAMQPLDASWRSGPAVIAMVNAVFGAHATITDLFPGRAGRTWQGNWRDHTTERRTLDGHAALLQAADGRERHRQALALIQEIDPLARGLTCAVLVRRNSEATELADFLRREGRVPAVAESDLCVCIDNPLGTALLALVQAVAHPDDSLAWEHVQMSPLAAALRHAGLADRETVTRHVLAQIAGGGFERFAEHWIARLPATHAFAGERARQFAAAATLFDATGSRDPDEFGQFMSRYALREPESSAVVRVMTVHKAKGLGFDLVILPELQGHGLGAAREGLAVHRDARHDVQWVIDLPPAWLAEQDAVLGAHLEEARQDAVYEALSLLYVAMTRAKRALYVITEPVKAGSKSNNFPKLLAETLGADAGTVGAGAGEFPGVWSTGNPRWFKSIPLPEPRTAAPKPVRIEAPAAPRHVARRPSGERAGGADAASLFTLRAGDSIEFGRRVHALLAGIEWLASGGVETQAQVWSAAGVPGGVVDEVVACLRAPELAGVWHKPSPHASVWRERAFEVALDGVWLSGVFDRVIVTRDAGGKAVGATVFDFKTDRAGDGTQDKRLIDGHSGQINLYRRVAGMLTGLPPERVGCFLVLTAGRRLLEVPIQS